MNEVVISVIIPIHNRAHLIGETLDSLRSQIHQPDEIIIVDDHSTDNLLDILQSYPEVKLLKSIQRGPGAARNVGFQYAHGKYIQFLDSDDVLSNNKLSSQLNVFNQFPTTDIVYGPFLPAQKKDNQWEPVDKVLQYYPLPNNLFINIVAQGWCNIFQTCLFKKEFLHRVGPWDEELLTHEDKLYWFNIALLKPVMKHENNSLTIYRQHTQQITDKHLSDADRTLNGIKVFELMLIEGKGNISLHSKNMLNGLVISYKKYLNRSGGNYSFLFKDIMCYFYYKLFNKIGRIQSKSNWQSWNGVEEIENTKVKNFI